MKKMQRVQKTLEIYYKKLVEDYDGLIIIAGDEGKGKSHLALNIIDYWIKITKNRDVEPEDVRHITLDKDDFVKELQNPEKYSIVVLDEAGELGSRKAMSRFNKIMTHAFQVIRGLNKLTILVLPSLWDIDSFFRRRRARGFFYVYKRGRVAFWSQDRLRNMVALNDITPIKRYWKIRPTFFDCFPKYKGVLFEGYKKIKDAKMQEMLKRLEVEMNLDDKKQEITGKSKIMLHMQEKGMTYKEIADLTGYSMSTVTKSLKAIKDAKTVGIIPQ